MIETQKFCEIKKVNSVSKNVYYSYPNNPVRVDAAAVICVAFFILYENIRSPFWFKPVACGLTLVFGLDASRKACL